MHNKRNLLPCRYATLYDWVLMVLGMMGAIGFGQALPMFTLLFGNAIDELGRLQVAL